MLAEIRLINVQEYHKMVEVGILDPDERVELIDGHIIKMAASLRFPNVAILVSDLLQKIK